ncbi:hypothetical protein J6590_017161 [Homalodisca vitripennis]|nr:hypothetical protein J6590_017161 [Homalodisca vitripennis]
MAERQDRGFLLYNLKLMRTICLWPLETKSAKVLYLNTIYTAFIIVSHALVSIGQTIEIFISPNISSMASVVDLATLTGSALFKMVYMIWYRADFQKLVDKIDSSFVESDSPADTVRMSDWLKNYKIIINVYVAMAMVALMPVGFTPYLSSNYSFLDNFLIIKGMQPGVLENKGFNTTLLPPRYSPRELSSNMTLIGIVNQDFEEKLISSKPLKSRKFPFNCWFPYDLTWSPMYEIIYLIELVPVFGCGYIYIVSDAFFFMVIYLVCGQLEILKASLRGLHDKQTSLTARKEARSLTNMNQPDHSPHDDSLTGFVYGSFSCECYGGGPYRAGSEAGKI